jgi:hypothetical protein
MTPYPPAEAETAPAIDVLIESPLWDALPDVEGIVRRAIAFAADEDVMMHHRGGELSVLLCDDAAAGAARSLRRRAAHHAAHATDRGYRHRV